MKKINILFVIFALCLMVYGLNANANVYVGNVTDNNSVYTLSDTKYDQETGEVTYQKISYNKNTYLTTNVTESDAAGGSVDVSNDAQYVFIPARYDKGFTDSTLFSLKYRNSGVEKLVLHAEYAAGVSQGGVDYKAGYRYVCVDAISTSSWNVTKSKSTDGYDITSVIFGSYANDIYDFTLVGFRLYFDYGVEVKTSRTFEIFGYDVHEKGTSPEFASDPKSTRISKFTSDDVEISNNSSFIADGKVTVKANIYDFTSDNSDLLVDFSLKDTAKIDFILDGESVCKDEYSQGNHTIKISLTKDNYSSLQITVEASATLVEIKKVEFLSKPYLADFTGSNYKFSTVDGNKVVTYDYKTGWNKITAPIKKYFKEYDYLAIEFNISHPIVMGIMIDDVYIRDHWKYTSPLEAGDHTFLFDISKFDITDSSSLVIYLDPAITNYKGTDGTKTVTFTKLEFIKSTEMPQADITVDPLFEFTYDGKGKEASGATSSSGATVYYEYKLEGTSDEYYDSAAPVDAGRYDVRVVSPLTDEYGKSYGYTKLVINKAHVSAPKESAVTVDYQSNKVFYDANVYLVALDENFEQVVLNSGFVNFGMTLYIKHIESDNYYASDSISIELTAKENKPSVSVNYLREMTVENIPSTVEYSIDGLTWTSGEGKKVSLLPGNIYLFRTKATSTSFASENTYLAINPRTELKEKLVLEATDNNSITVKAVDGAEYRLSDTVWQSSNVFKGLKAGSKVTVYMRIKGTSNSYASEEISLEVTVGQLKQEEPTQPAPETPEVTPTPGDVEEPSSGCNGSIVSTLVALVTLSCAVVFISLKRKEE